MTTQVNNSDLHFASVRELRSKFDKREISSSEVTKATLNRISTLEPRLNTFITVTPENAIRDAKLADERLQGTGQEPTALTGVPVMVKDNFSTKDVPTTAASNILKGYIPPTSEVNFKKMKAETSTMDMAIKKEKIIDTIRQLAKENPDKGITWLRKRASSLLSSEKKKGYSYRQIQRDTKGKRIRKD